MNRISGFRSARLRRNLTIQELSRIAGVSATTIRHCETGALDPISLDRVAALASALDITIAEGITFTAGGPRLLPSRHAPRNVLESYMDFWELTDRTLAILLDVSAQTVSVQCSREMPAMKYIRRLADHEEMSVRDFLTMYGEGMLCAE